MENINVGGSQRDKLVTDLALQYLHFHRNARARFVLIVPSINDCLHAGRYRVFNEVLA